MKLNRGQSIVEVVFAIGIIALTLTGVAVLMVFNLSARTSSFDRKKASELGEKVMEQLVAEVKNEPLTFWQLSDRSDLTDTDFPGYNYSVGFTNITNDSDYPNCGVGVTDCAEAVVMVGWSGSTDQSLQFSRFFSRK